jgi:hypothetical protein
MNDRASQGRGATVNRIDGSRAAFGGRHLVVASNRQPYRHDYGDDGEVTVDRENDVGARLSEYYGAIGGNIAEEFVYDANFIKLRQVRIGYGLPSSLLEQTPLSDAQVSLVGRNLFYLYDSVPNVSPESSYNNSSAPGFEQAGVPEARSIGFTVNAQF